MKRRKSTTKTKKALIILVIIIGLALLFLVLEKTGATNFTSLSKNHTKTQLGEDKEAKTTSKAPTAQSDYNAGNDNRDPGNTLNENRGSGIVKDNEGNVDTTTDQSKWTTSASGEITVYSPVKNMNFASGTEISGSSKLSVVSFRIIDSISGMISTGKITVVGGKFSGTANFNTNAKQGQIDVFGAKSDGTEFSNISIPVRLNQ